MENIEGVIVSSMKIIPNAQGELYHVLKKSSIGFIDFGEAYLTSVLPNEIKGWKKHFEMTLNLVAVSGEILVVVHDDRENSRTKGKFCSYLLSLKTNQRITIPAHLWVAFQGISSDLKNLMLNIGSIEHNPTESINAEIDQFKFEWRKK